MRKLNTSWSLNVLLCLSVIPYLALHQLCWVEVVVIWWQSCTHVTHVVGLPCLCSTVDGLGIASAMKTTLLARLSLVLFCWEISVKIVKQLVE
jgi:hypothetical protein